MDMGYAVLAPLEDDALRLEQLDQQAVQALMEGDRESLGTALGAYIELRTKLKKLLLDKPVVAMTNGKAAEVLRKIGSGDGLPSDKIIDWLAAHNDKDISADEFDDAELEELGSELFYSWYSHYEYVKALAELRPLVPSGTVPESVARLIWQVKQCYAFQQYDAAYGLCRTLLEASIRDICARCRLFPDLEKKAVLYRKHNWSQLRDRVSSESLNNKLDDLYGRLCEVLHARRTATAEEAHAAFKETLETIEQLYEKHDL